MDNKLPAISVIIPLYNTEKYIGECLDSLLAQTFQNFEVIVVDDCSTDSSCAIVENFIPQFDGRLKLSHMAKNTNGGGLPRNKGLIFSHGEYIFFIDADDLLTQTALEEMYTLAKDFDADVVYCEKFYTMGSNGENIQISDRQSGVFVDKPTLDPEDFVEKVQAILNGRFWWAPWCKLVRRDLITEHEIFFPNLRVGEDNTWTMALVFYSKKFLRVPNSVYYYRENETSLLRLKRTPQHTIHLYLNTILLGLEHLNRLMDHFEFFDRNPQFRYDMLEQFILRHFILFFYASFHLEAFEVYDTVKNEFAKNLGEHAVLISALCVALNEQQKISWINQENFKKFSIQTEQQSEHFKNVLTRANQRISELEKINREKDAYISELKNFILKSR